MIRNTMKLRDLETGMVIETNAGYKYIVLKVEHGYRFVNIRGDFSNWYGFSSCDGPYDDDMVCGDPYTTVIRVWKHLDAKGEKLKDGPELLWERPKAKELTIAQISARLGYPVKVIG